MTFFADIPLWVIAAVIASLFFLFIIYQLRGLSAVIPRVIIIALALLAISLASALYLEREQFQALVQTEATKSQVEANLADYEALASLSSDGFAKLTKSQQLKAQSALFDYSLYLRASLIDTPQSASLWSKMGDVAVKFNQPSIAETAYERSVNLDPVVYGSDLVKLATLYRQNSELQKALHALVTLIESKPNHEGARLLAGLVGMDLKRPEILLEHWQYLRAHQVPGSKAHQSLTAGIENARERLKNQSSGGLVANVTLQFSDNAREKLQSLSIDSKPHLFLLLRQAKDTGMPIAAKKIPLTLPITQNVILSLTTRDILPRPGNDINQAKWLVARVYPSDKIDLANKDSALLAGASEYSDDKAQVLIELNE